MLNIPFIKYSKLWLVVSGLIAVVCIVFLAIWGLKPGIDFTGGSLLELSFTTRPETAEMQNVFNEVGLKNISIQKAGDYGIIVRTNFLTEEEHQRVLSGVQARLQTAANQVHE
ncbi:MAG: hypothetical protein AAB797_02075, partial [Patescibacteria group bacterium]